MMKHFYYLLLATCLIIVACNPTVPEEPTEDPEEVKPKTEWELADSMYTIADYTVPSITAMKIAITACAKDSSEANLQALRQSISDLVPKTEPYCIVATVNGDPKTNMGFCWITNDSVFDGELQLVAAQDATEADFENGAVTIPATTKRTKGLVYSGIASYIVSKAGIPKNTKYRYISHKALASDLTPGTAYSWRVGYPGHWSEIGHFRTEDADQGEFSFLYMSDSHIMNQTYIDQARRCALAAVKTVPEAKFCVFPGDFVEDGDNMNSEWEWERWFEEAMKPLILAMPIVPTDGNHDASSNLNYTHHFNTDNTFYKTCFVPQFEGVVYDFVYGDALFLVFSMQDYWRVAYSYDPYSSKYLENNVGPWFKKEVNNHPEAKYRISLSHFNLFSGSDHSTDTDPPLFRACMLPVFKACEIDVALQGHDHTYEVIGPVNPDNCTPILDAITDREEVAVNTNTNMTGYKGGTYRVDDGTLYFIGATCGQKRYYPHSRERMETDYQAGRHNIENYFDLFTGMFGQPGKPSFTKITVKDDCIEFNSYTADDDNGSVTLFNTWRVVRTKPHTTPAIN